MIVVTDRSLCRRPFMEQLEDILSGDPEMVILREKSTPREDLLDLAYRCLMMCERYEVPLSLNADPKVAEKLDICRVHLPMDLFKTSDLSPFSLVGTSVHSVEEAVEAESLGADYIITGHIFETACKPFEPRGPEFLRRVCESVEIPVYAIGGITPENVSSIADAGASGACSMSGIMTAEDSKELIRKLTVPFC